MWGIQKFPIEDQNTEWYSFFIILIYYYIRGTSAYRNVAGEKNPIFTSNYKMLSFFLFWYLKEHEKNLHFIAAYSKYKIRKKVYRKTLLYCEYFDQSIQKFDRWLIATEQKIPRSMINTDPTENWKRQLFT